MTVNYIIVGYVGKRRMGNGMKPEEHFALHLNYLQNNKVEIDRVTVVINADDPGQIARSAKVLRKFRPYYVDLKVKVRHNVGHSYGGWNDAVNACIEGGPDAQFEEYFLIEDDYVPCTPDFLDPFRSAAKPMSGYICQMLSTEHGQLHAGASSGLLFNDVAVLAHAKNGSVFKIRPSIKYIEAEWNQVHFLDYITEAGYSIDDCIDYAALAWGDRDHNNRIYRRLLGEGSPVLEPLIHPRNMVQLDGYR